MNEKKTLVYINLHGQDIFVGELFSYFRANRETAVFEYAKSWLRAEHAFSLEPALFLGAGKQSVRKGLAIFGSFGDSAPDTWGRILMKRFEHTQARIEGRKPRVFNEIDFLLGVCDTTRQGALRFKSEENGVFLSAPDTFSVPPLIELPKLLAATEKILAKNEDFSDIKLLLAPGASLGGARPKASVFDRQKNMCIAKFPKNDDDFSSVLWEAVTLTLAKNAGLTTQQWTVEKIGEKPVLVVKRFDRIKKQRIPFLSAMSMLNAKDNEEVSHSYMEIADVLRSCGSRPKEDLRELWKRIAFSVMVSNTDDHLRNHGFLYDGPKGWRLSPAYDINPNPYSAGVLSTCISEGDNTASLDTVRAVAPYFDLKEPEAETLLGEIKTAVSMWEYIARQFTISRPEIEMMAPAFLNTQS